MGFMLGSFLLIPVRIISLSLFKKLDNMVERYVAALITTMLNWMVSFGLLERHEITDVRPMRTKYNVSKKGQSALNKIKSLDL